MTASDFKALSTGNSYLKRITHHIWCIIRFLWYNEIKYEDIIGDNIKSLRHIHDLTKSEFAKMVGISRNSLSRNKNGTSTVSTELIDRICQKFNVSYVDIVGGNKMLTPVEDYQLTLKV